MRFTGARNDKAHQAFMVGLDAACGEPYAKDGIQRVVDSSGLTGTCQHSHTLYPSACLVGETTRRHGLNLDRGGQPQDAQRVAGKREWHRETGKCSPQRMAPSVITPHDPIEAFLRLNRADSPSVIYLYRGLTEINHE